MFTLKNHALSPKNLSIVATASILAGCATPSSEKFGDAPRYQLLTPAGQPRVYRMRPMPEVQESFSAEYLVSKIPELKKISPVLIREIEQDYADKGGLYNPHALFEIQKYWKEHIQTEMMLSDLRRANAITPKFEAELRYDQEIPFRRMAVYDRWLKIRPQQY